jgi:hypothetical protein
MMYSDFARVIVEISNKESSSNKEVQEAEGDKTMDGQTVEGKNRCHLGMSIVYVALHRWQKPRAVRCARQPITAARNPGW